MKCDVLPKSPAIIWLNKAKAFAPALAVWSVDDPAAEEAPEFDESASLKVFAVLAKPGWLSNHWETLVL